MMRFVERHRDIVRASRHGPMGEPGPLDGASDLDLLAIRNIYEDARSGFLQLKRLGVATDTDFLRLFSREVQKRKRPVSLASHRFPSQKLFSAVANDYAVAVSVMAHVVRIA